MTSEMLTFTQRDLTHFDKRSNVCCNYDPTSANIQDCLSQLYFPWGVWSYFSVLFFFFFFYVSGVWRIILHPKIWLWLTQITFRHLRVFLIWFFLTFLLLNWLLFFFFFFFFVLTSRHHLQFYLISPHKALFSEREWVCFPHAFFAAK